MGVGFVLFFCMSLLVTKIYDQSKEIEELQLAGWKYRALRATLPANNANVIWLERNVWAGNKDGIRQCQQFVIRSTLVAWLVQELRGLHSSPLPNGNGAQFTSSVDIPVQDYPNILYKRNMKKGMSDTPCTCALNPLIFEFSDSAAALVWCSLK